jgi:hypothetical protein
MNQSNQKGTTEMNNTIHNIFSLSKSIVSVGAVVALFATSQPLYAATPAEQSAPTVSQVSITEATPGDEDTGLTLTVEGNGLCQDNISVVATVYLEIKNNRVPTFRTPVCFSDLGFNQSTGGLKRDLDGMIDGEGRLTLVTKEGVTVQHALLITVNCDDKAGCLYSVKLVD